jgi:hypothetical protein
MNGVTILHTFEVATKYSYNWDAVWISAIVCAGIALIIIGGVCLAGNTEWIALIVTPICALPSFIMGLAFEKPCEYETRYKVIVSEEVSMAEFTNKYKIIDTEGSIYIVTEVE